MAELPVRPNYGRKYQIFLRFLSETGNVRSSAKQAGFGDHPSLVYKERKSNPDFAADWENALDIYADDLEAEARRRAKNGVKKDVYYKGGVVGEEIVYSDGLMAKLLDGAKPEKYKPRENTQQNINVKVGIAVVPMQATNIEDWERDTALLTNQTPAIEGQFAEVKPEEKKPVSKSGLNIVRV